MEDPRTAPRLATRLRPSSRALEQVCGPASGSTRMTALDRCRLKKHRDAGIVDSERRGLWAYYYVLPEALDELAAWLG